MIDPRAVAILIHDKQGARPDDKTLEITSYRTDLDRVTLTFIGGRSFPYGRQRVTILEHPTPVYPNDSLSVFVDGRIRPDITEGYLFAGPESVGAWWHIHNASRGWSVVEYDRVQVLSNGGGDPSAREVLGYWRAVANALPGDNKVLVRNHEGLSFVHAGSALSRILARSPIEARPDTEIPLPIYPFHTNVSQREAVLNALRHPISVIDGPPGTGKTQTILNIIATVIRDPTTSVAVVSYNNSAVDNVYEKLGDLGFGFVAANLGNADKQRRFFDAQALRASQMRDFVSGTESASDPEELVAVSRRVQQLQEVERERAEIRHRLHVYRLEQGHFMTFFQRRELPDADALPSLRHYSATKLLDFIADTDPRWIRTHGWGRVVDAVNRYFKYRALRGVDAADAEVVLKLQRLYYEKKIAELERRAEDLTARLDRGDFAALTDRQQRLSLDLFRTSLRDRYAAYPPTRHEQRAYRNDFGRFARDYPLILSTCHSLRNSIGSGAMIDYLIIDEASQVDLVTAAPVLAHARHLIVVGDLHQLAPIFANLPGGGPAAPDPDFDYQQHSILSAVIARYPEGLPRVMLREHYRCDPDIIEFCNRSFYGGKLIPYTSRTTEMASMTVVRTVPGNHMRRVTRADTSRTERSNQREIDVINAEVLPWVSAEFAAREIGVTTPYRRQADKVTDSLIDALESDTVHRFQGREKDAIIMTTVLDDTPSARRAVEFADDPRLVNVAVSRAKRVFVLVTHHAMLPTSRNLRDLVGFIRYRDPNNAVVDSDVVSVFDLLYTDYAARVRPDLASEVIISTVLDELFAEADYRHLTFQRHVYLSTELRDNLARLDPRLAAFVRTRAHFDFVVYNRITNQRVCAIEVDGFRYHEADPVQLARDAKKNEICRLYGIPLLRLSTTGSNELARTRRFLDPLK